MSDFSRPEYRSYVELMQELRLERGAGADYENCLAVSGDWVVYWITEPVTLELVEGWIHRDEPQCAWLPALSDWLEILEAEGWTGIFISLLAGGHYVAEGQKGTEEEAPVGRGPTREEAAARLWMAVSGKTS